MLLQTIYSQLNTVPTKKGPKILDESSFTHANEKGPYSVLHTKYPNTELWGKSEFVLCAANIVWQTCLVSGFHCVQNLPSLLSISLLGIYNSS